MVRLTEKYRSASWSRADKRMQQEPEGYSVEYLPCLSMKFKHKISGEGMVVFVGEGQEDGKQACVSWSPYF